jgi:LysR family cys regulon transcriptional activator
VDATGLFPRHTTWIGFRRGLLIRRYMYDFLQRFAPHLDPRRVDKAAEAEDAAAVSKLFETTPLPVR